MHHQQTAMTVKRVIYIAVFPQEGSKDWRNANGSGYKCIVCLVVNLTLEEIQKILIILAITGISFCRHYTFGTLEIF